MPGPGGGVLLARRTSAPRRPRPAAGPSLAAKFSKLPLSKPLPSPPRAPSGAPFILALLPLRPPHRRSQLTGASRAPAAHLPSPTARGRPARAPLAHTPPTWSPPRKLRPSLGAILGAQQGPGGTEVLLSCPPSSPPPPPTPLDLRKTRPPGGSGGVRVWGAFLTKSRIKRKGGWKLLTISACWLSSAAPASWSPLSGRAWTSPSAASGSFCLGLSFPPPTGFLRAAALAASASLRPPARARPRRGPSALR